MIKRPLNARFAPAGKCRLTGVFPADRTKCEFNIVLDPLSAGIIAANFVKSYRQAIATSYPDPATRPALRKLQITITLPIQAP